MNGASNGASPDTFHKVPYNRLLHNLISVLLLPLKAKRGMRSSCTGEQFETNEIKSFPMNKPAQSVQTMLKHCWILAALPKVSQRSDDF